MGALLSWWLLLEVLGLVGLPLTARLFGEARDHGYAFSKILALASVTYVAWLLGHFGVAYGLALRVAVVLFALANVLLAWRDRLSLRDWLASGGFKTLLQADAWWTAAFLFFAWQRAIHPHIVDQEKYMDFAFFNTLIRTDVMPPEDPWMSGLPFNYYYFGYLMNANLARLLPLPSPIAYNLCVATLGGLVFAQLSAVGWHLTQRQILALLTGAFGVLLGNLDGLWQVLEKGTLVDMDYFRSTRIVGRDATINEFPYFTVIHGDLHPHLSVMPLTLLLVGWLLVRRPWSDIAARGVASMGELGRVLFLGFVFGAMVATSPWELPVGMMVTFLLLQRELPLLPLLSWPRIRAGLIAISVLAVGYVAFLPFYLHFQAPQGGVGFKLATTKLSEFLTVFGALLVFPGWYLAQRLRQRPTVQRYGQLLLAGLALALAIGLLTGKAVLVIMSALAVAAVWVAYTTETEHNRAPVLLVVAASVALLACELVYIKDPYGERLYRMNTVFKLYLQAWFLLSIATPWCAGRLWQVRPERVWRWQVAPALTVLLVLATLCYPVGVTATRLKYLDRGLTLDGNAYLRRDHPDDFAAIEWIRRHVPDLPVILEASGNPYSYYARFSSNTGLPTVMGWANHEGLWRSHDASVEARRRDVATIYSATSLDEVQPLLDRYRVRYIVVGEIERRDFKPESLEKFQRLRAVFAQGRTTIYER
ncbi:MAG: hypothetical protein KatS3mg077_1722 [Candidatus Binatia bacterium]|nr:MAG: hypothetical protein KatS3mg077_1722 [Candidatus Binatia bacterium]